jgi:hypothetical protein
MDAIAASAPAVLPALSDAWSAGSPQIVTQIQE